MSNFDQQILEIVKNYKEFGIVDDEARWAPELCRSPMPPSVRFSESDDSDTHGKKLYFLFAKDRDQYMKVSKVSPEIGQVVVKESWKPQEADESNKAVQLVVEKDGKKYVAKELAGLFIMFKLDPKTPETDNGWVYATVSADGEEITASGKVESCISCHRDAPHDRLFGLQE